MAVEEEGLRVFQSVRIKIGERAGQRAGSPRCSGGAERPFALLRVPPGAAGRAVPAAGGAPRGLRGPCGALGAREAAGAAGTGGQRAASGGRAAPVQSGRRRICA